MNSRSILFLIVVALVVDSSFAREWTDTTGKYKVQGEFVRVVGQNVVIRNEDGVEDSAPLEKLSDKDRAVVREYQKLQGIWQIVSKRRGGADDPEGIDPMFNAYRIDGASVQSGTFFSAGRFVARAIADTTIEDIELSPDRTSIRKDRQQAIIVVSEDQLQVIITDGATIDKVPASLDDEKEMSASVTILKRVYETCWHLDAE